MATTIDRLQIEINAQSKNANMAIDNLIAKISKLSTSLSSVNSKGSNNAVKGLKNLSNTGKTARNSLDNITNSANKSAKSFKGLASYIGKFYATYFMAIRGLKTLWKSIESTADYIEAYNYFNVALGKIGKDWSHQWEKYASEIGVSSAEEYADSFSSRLQENLKGLSGVSIELDAQGNGLLSTTGTKNLGLNIQEVTQYASQLASVTNSVGQTGEVSLATASAFTKLGADMSSLFNIDYSSVMNNLQSGLIGQSRALYKYGIDITNATLQTYAYELGLEKAVSEMTQAEKMQLRMIAILDQSKVSWGDLANTINSPSNMIRQFKNNLKETGMVFGQLFIPLLQKVLPVINGVTIALKNLFVNLAGFLNINIDLSSFGQGYSDIGEEMDGVADSFDNATESAKEWKNQLMGFDEINKLQEDKSSQNGVGSSIDLTDEILKATSEYEKIWQQAYDKMENDSEAWGQKIIKIFKNVSKNLEPITKPVSKFSSTALKDFYNEFLQPVGQWTIGEGLPAFIDAMKDFAQNLNWDLINKNLKDFWGILKNFTIGLGRGFLNFFDKYQRLSATLINGVSYAIHGFLSLINLFPPSVIEAFGESVGVLIGALLLAKSLSTVAVVISKISGAFASLLATLKTVATPITAIVASITGTAMVVYDFFDNPVEIGSGDIGDRFKKFSEDVINAQKEVDEIHKSVEEFFDEKQEISSKYDYISEISKKYIELSNSYNTLTTEQKNLVQTYASIIKENVDGIEKYINPITGAYTGTKEELDNLIQKTKEYHILLGAQQKMTEIGTQLVENKMKTNEAVESLNEALTYKENDISESYLEWAERVYDETEIFRSGNTVYKINFKDIINSLERVNYRFESLTESEKEQVNALYKYDEIFAKYIDRLQESANSVYGFTQITNDLEEDMKSLEDIVASSGETASDTANKGEVAILKLDSATKNLGNTSNNVATDISKTSENFKNTMENIKTSFVSTISKFIPESNNVFSKLFNNFKTEGSNIGTSFGDSIGKGIMDGVGKNESSIFDKIKGIFSNISVETVTDTVSSGLAMGFKVFSKIKGYSTGGFPEDGLFMANHNELIGQFSNGQTVVANNEQIIAGIQSGVYDAVLSAMNNANQGTQGDVVVQIDGKKVFQAVRKQHNNYLMQTGKNAFA